MRGADERKRDLAARHPHRHPQPYGPCRSVDATVFGQGTLHPPCARRCAPLVLEALVPDEQRVASELQDISTEAGGDLDQRFELCVDGGVQLLGTGDVVARQPLGQAREPRQIDGRK